MSAHTPGPWTFDRDKGHVMGARGVVAFMGGAAARDIETPVANGRLIAAAPDLLTALNAIVRITDGSQPRDYPGALMVARAAIAKAEGKVTP